jgi:hypothetical protein
MIRPLIFEENAVVLLEDFGDHFGLPENELDLDDIVTLEEMGMHVETIRERREER